jgi:hypothetical protein
VHAGSAVLAIHDPRGLGVLIDVVGAEEAPQFAREEARKRLREATGRDWKTSGEWLRWWEEHRDRIRWRENLKKFQ